MLGAVPFSASSYATVTVPSYATATGVQGAFDTGTVAAKAATTLYLSGLSAEFSQGFVTVRIATRATVTGVQARFDAGTTLVWSDILTGDASPWADVLPRPTPTGSAGVYGGAPYASIAYSGQLDGVLQYDQDDDWQDVAVADSSPWRDIIL